MEFDSFVCPVWQLPVFEDGFSGSNYVPMKAKYHCFVNGVSLCKKYHQITDVYDSGITVEGDDVAHSPGIVCKRCLTLWKKRYCLDD